MPRKAAAPASSDVLEPRRSSRIKEQPKVEAPPKKAAKPRAKKAKPADEKDGEAKESADEPAEAPKPKSARGKKRSVSDKDAEEPAEPPAAEAEEAPPSKKVCSVPSWVRGVRAHVWWWHDRPNPSRSQPPRPPLSQIPRRLLLNPPPRLHPRNLHPRLQSPHHGRLRNQPRLPGSLRQERAQGNLLPR